MGGPDHPGGLDDLGRAAGPVAGKPSHFEISYNPQAAPGAAGTIEHQWLARRAPHTARFRTVRTPAGFPPAEAYKQVVSTFTLTPEGAGTRVRLVSTGYPPGEALRRLPVESTRERIGWVGR